MEVSTARYGGKALHSLTFAADVTNNIAQLSRQAST